MINISINLQCLSDIKKLLLETDRKYEPVTFKTQKNVLIDFDNFFYSFTINKQNDKIISLIKTSKAPNVNNYTIDNENEIAKEITELKNLIEKA